MAELPLWSGKKDKSRSGSSAASSSSPSNGMGLTSTTQGPRILAGVGPTLSVVLGVATEVAFGEPTGPQWGWCLGAVTDRGLCAPARSHLCMPSWGQDTVAVLTFQAEAVPVLAQGAHLLCCREQGRTGLQEPSFPLSPILLPGDGEGCLQEASSIPPECQSHRQNGVWACTRACSLCPQGTQRLTLAQFSPVPQPGPHRRKRVAGNVGRSNSWLRSGKLVAAHSRHPAGTPFRPLHWLHP